MKVMLAGFFLFLCVCQGCDSGPTGPSVSMDPQQYLFFIREVEYHAEIVEGDYEGPSFADNTYTFDTSTHFLAGEIEFPISDSLLVVYADGMFLSGEVWGGSVTRLYGYYRFPAGRSPISIVGISQDGLVMFKDSTIIRTLRAGETLSHVEVRDDTVETGIIRLTISEWIANLGFWEESKIHNMIPESLNHSMAQPNNSLKLTPNRARSSDDQD